ncbi:hypothetical protein [Polyangium sp. 15x6]|uniref:hypothetical protein n=1 Tax=Polyangium sp. 15x6 TaxID=3042687 RepID=UPI00249C1C8B|nr:hypothetical protein [Polyangium sp. 15x6]MDI3286348.1 hypothetical protein [Polyangium sp. 15x6]
MRRGDLLVAALVVAAPGVVLPGCLWSFGEDEGQGRICAAPVEGGASCVSSGEGPASAWSQAAARGSRPIEMWAERPEGMMLDALVTSPGDMERWLGEMDETLRYVREDERCAESYKASMAGRVRERLVSARRWQHEILVQEPIDAVGRFKEALTSKGAAEKDPLVAEIAADKLSMGAVQGVLDQVTLDVGPLSMAYAELAADFAAYRKTEAAAEMATYTKLAAKASMATVTELNAIEATILEAAHDASAGPQEMLLRAMKLSAEIIQFEVTSQEALAPHADFMTTHGAANPDMTSEAQRSIHAMLGYIERRIRRSDRAAMALLFGIAMRRQALQLLGESQAVRDTVAEAKIAKAEATFHESAEAQVLAFEEAPPLGVKLSIPYLAKRYDEVTAFLQMRPLCELPSASWREAGCAAMRPHFKTAAMYRATTLPGLIQTGLSTMKAQGVGGMLLDAAAAKLAAGDVKGAAVLHDAACAARRGHESLACLLDRGVRASRACACAGRDAVQRALGDAPGEQFLRGCPAQRPRRCIFPREPDAARDLRGSGRIRFDPERPEEQRGGSSVRLGSAAHGHERIRVRHPERHGQRYLRSRAELRDARLDPARDHKAALQRPA